MNIFEKMRRSRFTKIMIGAALAVIVGIICLNGAAARYVSTGDKVIIMAFASMTPEEAKEFKPTVVFVDDDNKVSRVTSYEKHGLLTDM